VSRVGYWWGFSGVHTSGCHCSGARETETMGAGVRSMQRLDVRYQAIGHVRGYVIAPVSWASLRLRISFAGITIEPGW